MAVYADFSYRVLVLEVVISGVMIKILVDSNVEVEE